MAVMKSSILLRMIAAAPTKPINSTQPTTKLICKSNKHNISCTLCFSKGIACANRNRGVSYCRGRNSCTWEYDGTVWELIETETSPPSSSSEKLIYDSTQGLIRLVGDFSNWSEVWQYNGTDWQRIVAENSFFPFSSGWITGAYMPDKQVIYVLGACLQKCSDEGYYSGWLFDGKSWTEEKIIPFGADGAAGEPTYMTPEVVYLEEKQTLVLQTGFGGASVGSWALSYDGNEWKISEDSTSTSGINDLSLFFDMVYDSDRKVVVLFGAFPEGEQFISETWEYDGLEWKQVFPQRSPPVRLWHAMAYDLHHCLQVKAFGPLSRPNFQQFCLQNGV